MNITRKQLRQLIRESIEPSHQSEDEKIREMLTSSDPGRVKQGLDFIDLMGVEPYKSNSEKQFFEMLLHFLNNDEPEVVQGRYSYNDGSLVKVPVYIASKTKSVKDAKALYTAIQDGLWESDYEWLRGFNYISHHMETLYKGLREIRKRQIERKEIETFLASDDAHERERLTPDWYEDFYAEDDEKDTVMIARIGEIEEEIEAQIESMNMKVYDIMDSLIRYLDEEGRVDVDWSSIA